MLWAGAVGCDERQVDVAGRHAAELYLGLFGGLLKALHSRFVCRKVNAVLLLEFGNKVVDNLIVEVVAAEVSIAVGGKNLEHAVADFKN